MHEISNAGHWVYHDQPRKVRRLLDQFLSTIAS